MDKKDKNPYIKSNPPPIKEKKKKRKNFIFAKDFRRGKKYPNTTSQPRISSPNKDTNEHHYYPLNKFI